MNYSNKLRFAGVCMYSGVTDTIIGGSIAPVYYVFTKF